MVEHQILTDNASVAKKPDGENTMRWFRSLMSCFISLTITAISMTASATSERSQPWCAKVKSSTDSTVNSLSKRNTVASTQVSIFLRGHCYEGATAAIQIQTGKMKLCMVSVTSGTGLISGSICTNWENVSWESNVDNNGAFGLSKYVTTGSYYIAVYFPPYALQWWDGKPISDPPTPITITQTDTFHQDLHFAFGCRLSGNVSVDGDTTKSYTITAYLYDMTGIALFSTSPDSSGTFSFTGIPVGTYYLGMNSSGRWEKPFYPNATYADDARKLVFSRPGESISGISWIVKPSPSIPADTGGHLIVTHADTGSHGMGAIWRFVGMNEVKYSSTSSDTLRRSTPANQKLLLARMNNVTNPQEMIFTYFPGSVLRSEAETLSLAKNEVRILSFPTVESGRLTGYMPRRANISIKPLLVKPGLYTSLCAEPYADSTGFFTLCAPPGLYSLWIIPMTYKYFPTHDAWGAFRIDSLDVKNNQTTMLGSQSPPDFSHVIEGTITAFQDPVLVCFDSLSRPMSIAVIPIDEYLRNLTNERWHCFNFKKIFAPPYSLRFALNGLPAGKYTIVKAEGSYNPPGPFSVSWFGGVSYKRAILDIDDVASLTAPPNVQWVGVDSTSATVEIGAWDKSAKKKDLRTSICRMNNPKVRCINKKIIVALPNNRSETAISVLTIAGQLIAQRMVGHAGERSVVLPIHQSADQVLIVNVKIENRMFNQKVLP